ncbi:hypothetical protein FOZ60_012351 [Perkinsus olseni]|uniref:Uncharacterized protein n=1 Tax=Perkinsus olseni TaxID=32597 RepID=A0A7J6NBL2_PEROL|nr:hypothetical protein FOZ60_012351 [Perkinsus olseni]
MPSDVTDEEAERLMIEKLQTVYGSIHFDPLKAHHSIDLHAAEIRELIAISLPRLDASSAEMLACRFFWNSIPWTGAARQLYCTWQSSAQDLSHALDLCRTLYDDDEHVETPQRLSLSYLLLLQLLSSRVTRVKASLPKVWAIIKEAARAKGKLKANRIVRVAKAARVISALMMLPLIHILVRASTLEWFSVGRVRAMAIRIMCAPIRLKWPKEAVMWMRLQRMTPKYVLRL